MKHVVIGLVLALTLGLAGCPIPKDKLIFVRGGGDLSGNNDVIPGLTTAFDNNLAPDGGGLSPNDADAIQWTVKFNSGDGNAVILFQVADVVAGSTVAYRVYASHYDGASLTPPVELLGNDRDERAQVDLGSYVCVPLNTAGYAGDGSSASATAIRNAQSNDGGWLILGEATTLDRDPALDTDQVTTNAAGPRHALYYWVFVRSLRLLGSGTHATGGNADGGATTTVLRSFRHGFMETGELVNVGNPEGGSPVTAHPSSVADASLPVPPNHVTSYGVVSDTLRGSARFGGAARPFSNVPLAAGGAYALGSSGLSDFRVAVPYVSANMASLDGAMALSPGDLVRYHAPVYEVGDATSFITVVWTQVVNSRSDDGAGYSAPLASGATPGFAGGHALQLRRRVFNLATLSFDGEADAKIDMPAGLSATFADGRAQAGTQPFPGLVVSDGMLFFKYADASLIVRQGSGLVNELSLVPQEATGELDWRNGERDTGGHEGYSLFGLPGPQHAYWQELIAVQRFDDDGDGTAGPRATCGQSGTGPNDVSIPQGATFANHTPTAPTIGLGTSDTYPGRHIANFKLSSLSFNAAAISDLYGPDQGVADHTLFFSATDNTRATLVNGQGGSENIDIELWAAALHGNRASPSGTQAAGSLVPGINPIKLSAHQEDWPDDPNPATSPGAPSSLVDPVLGINLFPAESFRSVLNRSGDYLCLAYRKATGQSAPTSGAGGSFHMGLFTVAYRFQRPVSNSDGVPPDAPVNMEDRLAFDTSITSQRSPFELTNLTLTIDNPTARSRDEVLADAGQHENWDLLPVQSFQWQGKLGKGGFQSNPDVVHILFEQSDATNDRIFVRRLDLDTSVTPPTLSLHANIVELDTEPVSGLSPSYDPGGTRFVSGTQNGFLQNNGFLAFGRDFFSCDIGPSSSSGEPQLLVVYHKVVDDTDDSVDGNGGDKAVKATVIDVAAGTGGGASGFLIGRNLHEDTGTSATALDPDGFDDPRGSVYNAVLPVPEAFGAANMLKLVCLPNDANAVNYPTLGSGTEVVVLFTDRVGGATTDPTTAAQTALGNNTSRVGLFSRTVSQFSNALTSADQLFTPSVVSTGFRMPFTIDHAQGVSDHVDIDAVVWCGQVGDKLGVVFEANDQHWFNQYERGGWLEENGISNPLLLTHDSSQNVLEPNDLFGIRSNWTAALGFGPGVPMGPLSASCFDEQGDLKQVIFAWLKFDNGGQGNSAGMSNFGDLRLRVRTGQPVQ